MVVALIIPLGRIATCEVFLAHRISSTDRGRTVATTMPARGHDPNESLLGALTPAARPAGPPMTSPSRRPPARRSMKRTSSGGDGRASPPPAPPPPPPPPTTLPPHPPCCS